MSIQDKAFAQRFGKEIIDRTLELSEDYFEIPLDTLTQSEVLKEVPIVKTFLALFKVGVSYRERSFLRKILKFLAEYNSGSIDEYKIVDFRNKFEANNKYRDKVLDFLLLELDRINSEEKSQILGRLFLSYLNGYINWDHLVHLGICLEQLHPKTYGFLKRIALKDYKVEQRYPVHEGLLAAAGIGSRNSYVYGSIFEVTELGKDLYKYGLAGLNFGFGL